MQTQAKVELIHNTIFPEMAVIGSFRICRASEHKTDSILGENGFVKVGPRDEALIKMGIDQNHLTPFEFAHFVFDITLSRLAHTQLVRHRMSSFCAQSGRHIKVQEFYIPDTIRENPALAYVYEDYHKKAVDAYENMIKMGIPLEDARYLLPGSSMSKVRYHANMRSLRNAISERTCKNAHKEIRDIFLEIKEIVKRTCPILLYKVEKFHNCPIKCGECIR